MPLTHKNRLTFTAWYCFIFYALMVYKWSNGQWLFQLKPHLYNTRFDIATWLMMKTSLHAWLIDNPGGWLIFDATFYLLPIVYLLIYKRNEKAAVVPAVLMLAVNFVYITCYTLYPSNSIESFIPWLLFPFLFMSATLGGFYFILYGLRYFFLFLLSSAAVWKIVQHGIFNIEEMSGILLVQHKEYLTSSPGSWYSSFVYWLISHSKVSYILYLAATIVEFIFLIGFFTKRYDRHLIALFFLFIVMDVLIMRIPYMELIPFILTLIYSKYKNPSIASRI